MTVNIIKQPKNNSIHPFTICIIANPLIIKHNGNIAEDPIIVNKRKFDISVHNIYNELFGNLPNQTPTVLSDPTIFNQVKFISIFDKQQPSSLVKLHYDCIEPNRKEISNFISQYEIIADVVFVVSDYEYQSRETTIPATDDNERGGIKFILDNLELMHCFFVKIPGTIAINATSEAYVALHEFQHAMGSYQNGTIVDLYIDQSKIMADPSVNCRIRDTSSLPPPPHFATYHLLQIPSHFPQIHRPLHFTSDPQRTILGYPSSWKSYHCQPINRLAPTLMDNFLHGGVPHLCDNDEITRAFLFDRIHTRMAR